MNKPFGTLPTGEAATLYTISGGRLQAAVADYGATLVSLWVDGVDVVLGYDDVNGYAENGGFLGAVVGRNANRIGGASFYLNGKQIQLTANDGVNNLHSGPNPFNTRFWTLDKHTDNMVRMILVSPEGDQGFPGKATLCVTYRIDANDILSITYDAICTKDTIFNLTNHAYFNLAGEDHPEKAMSQTLMLPARIFTPNDAGNVPTGELRSVIGTPFDFRTAKPIGQDIDADDEALRMAGGYDHNFEVFCAPCAILTDPDSGRSMAVTTDCPGVQLYTANFLDADGKGETPLSPPQRRVSGDPVLPRRSEPPRVGTARHPRRRAVSFRDQVQILTFPKRPGAVQFCRSGALL